jgi:hypothetical protein
MATISAMLRRFEDLDTDAICKKAVEQSTEMMADLNAEQINSGIKADGTEMPDYSLRSVVQYGKPFGPIRLRDTGSWQTGLYARVDGEKVVFASSDTKDAMLRDRYGDEIEGLSEKFKAEAIREVVQPNFNRMIEEETGLKMK